MKKIIYIFIVALFTCQIFPQGNVIQSIDFDTQQRVVYGLTGNYDFSSVIRYKDGNLEKWNLTQMFSLPFYWVSTTIDKNDTIWAFQQNKLYKFDGENWMQMDAQISAVAYIKYSDIIIDDNNNLWLTTHYSTGVSRLNLTDMSWTIFDPLTPENSFAGVLTIRGDSTWVPTSGGLVLIYNDNIDIILDTLTSSIPSQGLYCFYIDSNNNKWLGSYNAGLIKWINDTTFISYNTENSNLPNNFVNTIDEDSKGNLWLGTDGGLACLKNDTIISYSNLIPDPVVALKVDNLDRIWFGHLGYGNLLMFDGSNVITVTSINNNQHAELGFSLKQNYPNPFNSITKISYELSKSSKVDLKIFNTLGQEVATVVNEEKPAGYYEVEFDASSLTSGIYYYTLRAGDLVQTKKMILIK